MKSKELQLTREGIQLKAWLFFPEKESRALSPLVIFCHGIPGSKPDPKDRGYLDLAEDLSRAGFCSVFFNFRGCGQSGGNIDMEGWYRDMDAVLFKVSNMPGIDPGSIHAIGFSAGGAIASKVVSIEKKVQSLLLMATPCDFSDILPEDPFTLKHHFVQLGLIRDSSFPHDIDRWYQGFLDLNPKQCLAFIAPRHVGIVHGDQDDVVPVAHARQLYDSAYKPKKLIILEGANHQLRKDSRIHALIRDWLAEVAW